MNLADADNVQKKLILASRFSSMGLVPSSQRNGNNYAPSATGRFDDLYGIDANSLCVPTCHSTDLLLMMADRWQRADAAHAVWAAKAKECVDFVEGRQWTQEELCRAEDENRPVLAYNKIGPLVRLVLGYHRNNRVQNTILPTDDANSTQDIAETLSKIDKRVSDNMREPYVDTESFMDGIISARGYTDYRLSFEENDFGDLSCSATDPFTVRIDPDANTYETIGWNYMFEARWWSIDEIDYTFGKMAAMMLMPMVRNGSYTGGLSNSMIELSEEITPWRNFGGAFSSPESAYLPMDAYIANSYDPLRKNIRVIDCQHYVRVQQMCIVNLETGDRTPIPDHFTVEQIQKMMQWCSEQYSAKGQACPLRVSRRPIRRVRWTTIVGDLIVHDDWSPYSSFTKIPYFPWFRRGMTRGMVEDLIDPQRGANQMRSAWVDTTVRTAHSGWMWHENGLSEDEKIKVERYGAAPGINIEWKGRDPAFKPEKINPSAPATAFERLEQRNTDDLKEISGINDSALGQLDAAQSGRAIEARQRQSVLGIETYMDNYKRTAECKGRKKIEVYQEHYTEARMYRLTGDDGNENILNVNFTNEMGEIVNDLSLGKYKVEVSETPLTATYLNAQMEELTDMAEKGLLPIPLIQDIAIDLSTLPGKTLLKARVNALMKAQGMLTADELLAAVRSGAPIAPGQIPQAAPPPGAPSQAAPPPGGAEGGLVASTATSAPTPVPAAAAPAQPAPALASGTTY